MDDLNTNIRSMSDSLEDRIDSPSNLTLSNNSLKTSSDGTIPISMGDHMDQEMSRTSKKRVHAQRKMKTKQHLSESKIKTIAMGMQKKLGERKLSLLIRVLRCAGLAIAQRVLKETLKVEQEGGLETQEGKRRSAGGTYFTLLKEHVSEEMYKDIYAIERQIKQKSKARKRKSSRPQPMDIDEPESSTLSPTPKDLAIESLSEKNNITSLNTSL